MTELIAKNKYRSWIVSIRSRVQSSHTKAAIAVNRQLIELYSFLGEKIVERPTANWGDGCLQQMRTYLLIEFLEQKHFLRRILRSIRQWHQFWESDQEQWKQHVSPFETAIWTPAKSGAQKHVSQIAWGHNILLIQTLRDPADALYYVQQTIENNWSRAVLTHQIESGLHLRDGKAIDHFDATLQGPESDLARQLLRDPYACDLLTLTKRYNERELEDWLIDHLTKLPLKLGAGFAFTGRQYKVNIDGKMRRN